jgi:hypothetical protein
MSERENYRDVIRRLHGIPRGEPDLLGVDRGRLQNSEQSGQEPLPAHALVFLGLLADFADVLEARLHELLHGDPHAERAATGFLAAVIQPQPQAVE